MTVIDDYQRSNGPGLLDPLSRAEHALFTEGHHFWSLLMLISWPRQRGIKNGKCAETVGARKSFQAELAQLVPAGADPI